VAELQGLLLHHNPHILHFSGNGSPWGRFNSRGPKSPKRAR
jgi:hypothetical protein